MPIGRGRLDWPSFSLGDLSFSPVFGCEVSAHYADVVLTSKLLELLAGAARVARQLVDGTDGDISLEEKVRASLASRLEDDRASVSS